MNTLQSPLKSLCLILAIAFVSIPEISLAGDTDPNGVRLMLLREEPKFMAGMKEH